MSRSTYPTPTAPAVKRAMRERIRAERRRRIPAVRAAEAQRLVAVAREVPEIAAARCLAAYISTGGAPGTAPLRFALRTVGVRVLLPVLIDDGRVAWTVDGQRMVDGQPWSVGADGLHDAQAVIVPALAVDTLGNRLGQGAGFYDRLLRTIDPTVSVFALVYESEVLDAAVEPVPDEPHDRPVDGIITPNRCLRLPRRRR